jgi:obg-like ATPase 1
VPHPFFDFGCLGAFADGDVSHVEGEVDPVRDMEIIHEELRLKDEEFLKKYLDGLESSMKRMSSKNMDKNKQFELETVKALLKMVKEDKKDIRTGEWSNKEVR